jgi:hypothetical protein
MIFLMLIFMLSASCFGSQVPDPGALVVRKNLRKEHVSQVIRQELADLEQSSPSATRRRAVLQPILDLHNPADIELSLISCIKYQISLMKGEPREYDELALNQLWATKLCEQPKIVAITFKAPRQVPFKPVQKIPEDVLDEFLQNIDLKLLMQKLMLDLKTVEERELFIDMACELHSAHDLWSGLDEVD